ncbi:hypothetical protein LL962_12160 [Xanthomonas sp. NCPPB 1067]|nr:hypothetical protein [Xanthomonas sp. NCPPB 1067]MCC4587845.1 hypothetical protein [Xanthomonas sp. NCPPB 1067]
MIQTTSSLSYLRQPLLLALAAVAIPFSSLAACAWAATVPPLAPLPPTTAASPIAPATPSAPGVFDLAGASTAPRRHCGVAAASGADASAVAQGDAYVLVYGDRQTMHGSLDDLQTARSYQRHGERLLWFRADGVDYLVRNPTLLYRMAAAHAPVRQLDQAQAALDARRQALSEQQAALAAQLSAQARPRLLHASTGTLPAPVAADEQAAMAPAALQGLARQQRTLADRQARLAARQAAASTRATRQALQVLRDALKSGLATRVAGQS